MYSDTKKKQSKSLSTPILRESVTNKELNKLKVNTNNIQHQYSCNMNKHHKISLYGGVTIALNTFRSMRNNIIKKSKNISNINNKYQCGFKYRGIFMGVITVVILIMIYLSNDYGLNAAGTGPDRKDANDEEISRCLEGNIETIAKGITADKSEEPSKSLRKTMNLWLSNIPACIANMKENDDCWNKKTEVVDGQIKDVWQDDFIPYSDNVKEFYNCLNGHIELKGEELVARKSEQLALYSGEGAKFYIGNEGDKFFYDEKTDGTKALFAAGNRIKNANKDLEYDILSDLLCVWVVAQSKIVGSLLQQRPQSIRSIVVFGSLSPYDEVINGGPISEQATKLIEYGITEALVVGGYFWKTELLMITSLNDQDKHGVQPLVRAGSGRAASKQRLPTKISVPVNLFKYKIDESNIEALGKSFSNDHAAPDLFGQSGPLDIPIVFKCINSRTIHPIKIIGGEHFGHTRVPTIAHLIDAFNKKKEENTAEQIDNNGLGYLSFRRMFEFIQFTIDINNVVPDLGSMKAEDCIIT